MNLLPSASSILARQVRIIVSPPTQTLFESSAILSEVQSKFGVLSTFLNQRNDRVLHNILQLSESASMPRTSSQTIIAIFASSSSKTSALNAGPISVACGGDLLPSVTEADPYNARRLAERHRPSKRVFTCQIVNEEDQTLYQGVAHRNPYAGSFRPDATQPSYHDLLKSGAKPDGLADIMQIEQRNGREQDKGETTYCQDSNPIQDSTVHGLKPDRLSAGLMETWRRGVNVDGEPG